MIRVSTAVYYTYMAKHKKPFSCGLGPALSVITGKWKPVILWRLHERTLRFSELQKSIDTITEKMLFEQLRELEVSGLIRRVDYNELPPRVEYSLTSLGEELNDLLDPLAHWGKQYASKNDLTGLYS